MRVATTLIAALLICAGCHRNTDPGTPAPTTCDPSLGACPNGTPTTGQPPATPPTTQPPTSAPPTSAPTNPPPTTTPPNLPALA